MGFRFQKRIKLLPGVRLNLSKSGVSTSIGGRGATVNLRKGRARATVGLPGTGLSYSVGTRRAASTPTPRARSTGRTSSSSSSRWLAGAMVVVLCLLVFLVLRAGR